MGQIRLIESAAGDVPAPPAGSVSVFLDSATGVPAYKDADGVVYSLGPSAPAADYVSGIGGSGHLVIPGIAALPDIEVAGTDDDEFDATWDSTSGGNGWTGFGAALAEADSNTHALSHLHLRTAAASGDSLSGVYKACPSLPFTVTAKLADAVATSAGHKAGLFIGDSTPTKVAFVCFGGEAGGSSLYGTFEAQVYTNLTTWGSNLLQSLIPNGYPPAYLRIIAASSTDVTFLYSHNGLAWITLAANVNPSMTVATVGLLVNRNASHQGEAFFDWIRFS